MLGGSQPLVTLALEVSAWVPALMYKSTYIHIKDGKNKP